MGGKSHLLMVAIRTVGRAMSDASDMETIVALLGNLIERVEGIEKQQMAQAKVLEPLRNHVIDHDERMQKILESLRGVLKGNIDKLDKLSHQQETSIRTMPNDDMNAKRHGEINEWTGDLSRKLSDVQITLDRIEGKKRGIFG